MEIAASEVSARETPPMTPQQIDLVQSSFKKVVPIAGTAADLFYDRLFEIAPEVRSMFPQDLSEQKKKLMACWAPPSAACTSSRRSFRR